MSGDERRIDGVPSNAMNSASRSSGEAPSLSRRHLLAGAAAVGLGLGASRAGGSGLRADEEASARDSKGILRDELGTIPRRRLGKTGVDVSILGLGTATMGENPSTVDECASVFAEAIERGINYIDTARIYGNAEEALGRIVPAQRDKVFLVTKCMTDSAADAQKSFEESLRLLKVDAVDVLHLHSTGDRDLHVALGENGAWSYIRRMKKEGKARFIGITGHNRPAKFLRMLETGEVDVMMVAMNFVDRHVYGFEEKVLPKARELGVGVMAMKTFGGLKGGFRFTRRVTPSQMDPIFYQNAVRYSLSLEGVTGIVIGVKKAEELRQNIRYVLHAVPLSDDERDALRAHGEKLAAEWGPRFGAVE